MRFRMDGWHGDYAFPYRDDELEEPPIDVDVDVEAPAHDWAPIGTRHVEPFPEVRFIDGVQASDAVVWIDDPQGGDPEPGLVASWAAGAVVSRPDGADLVDAVVERGVFSDARALGPIIAGNVTWRPYVRRPGDGDDLANRLRGARRRLEADLGRLVGEDDGGDPSRGDRLVVYDGLLHAGPRRPASVGLAKRAHRTYLPPPLQGLLRTLRAGERTPLFLLDARGGRYSCYVCLADPLPPAVAAAGSGVARIELDRRPGASIAEVAAFADRVAATLPPFASEPHRDPRAPQNLYPVRDLERELRRLLGRPAMIRPLLAGCAATS